VASIELDAINKVYPQRLSWIASPPVRTPVAVGDRVRLQLSGSGRQFFDTDDGKAIR
jgi:hypothetical protein